jgi:hypothetical protein
LFISRSDGECKKNGVLLAQLMGVLYNGLICIVR